MTSERRFEQDLPDLFAELAPGSMPDYRDDIVQRTARMRQRPAWAFPERWFPVDLTTRRVFVAPVRWRTIGVVLLVAALVVAAVLAFGGGRSRQLPLPFGPAGNGLIAYAADGDIHLGDPVTGASRPVISGPETDHDPVFSKTGDRFVFLRNAPDGNGENLLIANADGTGIRALTRAPLHNITGGDWSADGRTIVIVSSIDGRQQMSLIDVARGNMRTLDVGMEVQDVTFIPPKDVEIAFVSSATETSSTTYAVRPDGSGLRPLVSESATNFSPDGSLIAYAHYDTTTADRSQVHVIGADGRGDRILENPAGVQYQGSAKWSPDGARLLIARAYENHDLRLVVVPASGVGPEIEFVYYVNGGFGMLGWSPDGKKVVFSPDNTAFDTVVFDVASGSYKTVPRWWTSTWQRVAP